MSEYSQGVCMDGAAILKDGAMMTIEEIVAALREGESLRAQLAEAKEINSKWRDYAKNEGVRRQGEIKTVVDGLQLEAQSGEAVGEVMRFEEIIYAELTSPTIEMVGAKIYLALPAAKVPERVTSRDFDQSSPPEDGNAAEYWAEGYNQCVDDMLAAQEGEK